MSEQKSSKISDNNNNLDNDNNSDNDENLENSENSEEGGKDALKDGSYRTALPQYVQKAYKTKPDYPWKGDPESAVLRHEDNQKWYGLVMEVDRAKLGLSGKGKVCALNVKTRDQMFHDMLITQAGYFPGYHMNKEKWITILMDGTVPFGEICGMLDASYETTASGKKKQKIRPPKEWLVPANPKFYDVEAAFQQAEVIDWKQGAGIRTGDTVYLYMAAPVSAILYQCKVTETDIPCRYQDENLTITSMMKIRLLKRYLPEQFPFGLLKSEYGIFAVRGPRGVPVGLSQALRCV